MSATARTFTLYLYSEDCLHHDLEGENAYSGHTERPGYKAKKVTVPKVCSTVQSLLRDIGWCCKKGPLPSKVLWMHWMCCNVVSLYIAKCTLHYKVTCS